jgi:hypothetical protein
VQDDSGVLEAFAALADAMVLADPIALDALIDDAFTARWITGTEWSRAEWLGGIDDGSLEYEDVDVVEAAVRPLGERAVVTVRTVTTATLSGVHARWRLQLRLDYERRAGAWIAMRFVTASW